LVGGSAFEWHFPGLHASDDLDVVLLSFLTRPSAMLDAALAKSGFIKSGKAWTSAAHYFSIDIVGTMVYLGNTTATDQIEQATAQSGELFEILSATAMWCDRAIAWDALTNSTRDEIHVIQAFYKHQAKIDTHIALKILNKEGVAKRLHRKIKKREDLKKLSEFLSS
jgi:hypothetical protein